MIPSERSRTQKATLHAHLYGNRQVHTDRKQTGSCWGLGSGDREVTVCGYRLSSGGDGNVLELDRGELHPDFLKNKKSTLMVCSSS